MIYDITSLTPAPDPLTAPDPVGRPTQAPLAWWQAAYPETWRPLLATGGYAVGHDDDPAPWGLADPVLEHDAEGLSIVRRTALPEPTPEERLAAERAALQCTPYAGEIVLARHGLRQSWLALMAALPEEDQVRYSRAPLWHRTDPLIDLTIQRLRPDLDADQAAALADDLFREAMGL